MLKEQVSLLGRGEMLYNSEGLGFSKGDGAAFGPGSFG